MIEAELELTHITINGLTIVGAIPVAALHEVLGPPQRIVDPAAPAPVGHRNNQIHVYDSLGTYFYEHHFTHLAMAIAFVFWPEEQHFKYTPTQSFAGRLILAGYDVPACVSERELTEKTRLHWNNQLKGTWSVTSGEFSIGFDTIGERLKSGRRSDRRRVVSIDASWPHDPTLGAKPKQQRSGDIV